MPGKRRAYPVLFYAALVCLFAGCEQAGGIAPVTVVPGEEPTEPTTGTLRYAVTLPSGLALDPEKSFIRIERDGQALESLSAEDFSGGTRTVSGDVEGELTLEQGPYEVVITLTRTDGYLTNRWESVEIAVGEEREVGFSPDASDFLDPATQIAAAGSFQATANNTSGVRLASGGGSLAPTQTVTAAHDKAKVHFVYFKANANADSQTLTVGGRDAAKVAEVAGADGSSAARRRAVFTVDTGDIATSGGERVFTLRLDQPGALSIQYTVTVVIPHCVKLGINMDPLYPGENRPLYPLKRNYAVGEETFNGEGLSMTGHWSDGATGPVSADPAVGGWEPQGFDTSSLGTRTVSIVKHTVAGTVTAREYNADGAEKPGTGSIEITVKAGRLYFDRGYGTVPAAGNLPHILDHAMRSAVDYPYTLTAGRTLVMAPIKWHIPGNAVYEWRVDEALQASATTEYFSYTASAQGTRTVTVTAKSPGGAVLATATAKVQCTSGATARPATAASSATATKLYSVVAPGQFGSMSDRLGDYHGFGGFGGRAVFKFDHSVMKKPGGEELKVGGNAFGGWEEPGIIWVSQDENNNGKPDDTWYELKGSHTLHPETIRRFAITYYKTHAMEDNQGVTGRFDEGFNGTEESYTLAGTRLPGRSGLGLWGYADVSDNGLLSLSNAIQADAAGTPADLPFIDFLMIVTGQDLPNSIVGEHSTEAGTPTDRSIVDPAFVLTGISQGSGQYKYTFVNNSGYDLTITFCGETFELKDEATASRTVNVSSAPVDFFGGNVTMIKTEGQAKFTSG